MGEIVRTVLWIDTKYESLDYGVLTRMAEGMRIPINQTFFENLNIFEHIAKKYLNGQTDNNTCNAKKKEECRFDFGEWLESACKTCKNNVKSCLPMEDFDE